MDRSSATFRRTARLALVAVLISALMPTASRVIANAAPGAAAVLVEMCTAAGVRMIALPPSLAGDPAPPAMPDMDACDYCVLATPPPVTLPVSSLLPPAPQAASPVTLLTPLRRPARNTRGLGAQAPPFPL